MRELCPKCGHDEFGGPVFNTKITGEWPVYSAKEVLTYKCDLCGYEMDKPCLDQEKK